MLSCLLLLEDYGISFENFSSRKNMHTVAYALFCLVIDSLKIQEKEKESLTLLSRSEIISINKIEFPMRTALIFK
jgi:hypothetical protein